jgi:hypothetical protein
VKNVVKSFSVMLPAAFVFLLALESSFLVLHFDAPLANSGYSWQLASF